MNTFTVRSSHGRFIAHTDTGEIVERTLETVDADQVRILSSITRFDVGEYAERWGRKPEAESNVDILNLGYWYGRGSYEPPVEEWREEFDQGNQTTIVRPQSN